MKKIAQLFWHNSVNFYISCFYMFYCNKSKKLIYLSWTIKHNKGDNENDE